MRFSELQTITLINSAEYRYTNIHVDGNVLFTGKNGTGKTTIMRSLLFFFIAKEKKKEYGIINDKDFREYYFPYEESYLIYSYKTELSKNFVVVFKENNLLRFKFFAVDDYTDIDLRTIFIEDGQTLGYFEAFSKFREHSIQESDIIKRNSHFIDILCAQNNTTKKTNLSIFTLFKTKKDYLQIGKTIQNIFLNSKVESESIKNLLISSIDDSKEIHLDIIQDSIERFNTKYENIKYFKENNSLASNIANAFDKYEGFQFNLSEITAKIVLREEYIKNETVKISQNIESQTKILEEKKLRLEDVKNKFKNQESDLIGKISVNYEKIKECTKNEEKFIKNGAKDKLVEYHKLAILKNKKEQFDNEYKILVGDSKDKVQEFDNQKIEIINTCDRDINTQSKELMRLKENFHHAKELKNTQLKEMIEKISINPNEEIEETKGFIEQLKQLIHKKELEKIKAESESIENQELLDIKQNIQSLEKDIKELEKNNTNLNNEMFGFDKDIEFKNKELSTKLEIQSHKHDADALVIKNNIITLEKKVNFKKESFISFLQESNHPNKNKLFTILKDEILISTKLNPVMKNKQENSLFGIEINVDEIIDIDKLKLTLQEHKDELLNLESKYENLKIYIKDENAKELKNIEKNRTKCRNSISDNEKSILRLKGEINAFMITLADLEETLIAFRDNFVKDIVGKITEYKKRIENGTLKAKEIEKNLESAIKEQKEKSDAITEKLSKTYEIDNARINKQIEDIDEYKRTSLAKIKDNKTAMLKKSGISEEIIITLSSKIEKLKEMIEKIESYKDVVDDYIHIKKNLLDNLPIFIKDKKSYENKKAELTEIYEVDKKRWEEICKNHSNTILKLKKEIEVFDDDLVKYKSFEEDNSDFIQTVKLDKTMFEKILKNSSSFKDDTIDNLCINFGAIDKELIKITKKLSQDITTFYNGLNIKEVFNLYINKNNSDSELLNVSKSFHDFIIKDKIELDIRESKKTFSMQINKVIQDIDELKRGTSIVSKNISEINSELKHLDEIEVIREFSMRAEPSDNIVLIKLDNLQKIYEKYEIVAEDLGLGLFSFTEKSKSVNPLGKKADLEIFEALKSLGDSITDNNSNKIEIKDCFELEFKVTENNNKGVWTKTLDGVGSEGTDVIVKIMINVALLSLIKKKTITNDVNLFCLIDEIGKLHPQYLAKLLKFANNKNIYFINGVPTDMLIGMYRSHYKLKKDKEGITSAVRVLYKNYKAE
ncbi:MAG: ATP-binding protein [Campylobacterota bacterium]|nr:ATP-binding protein [Campylobacterota bacterium]